MNKKDLEKYAGNLKKEIESRMTDEERSEITINQASITMVNDQSMVGLTFRKGDSAGAPSIWLNEAYELHFLKGEPIGYQAEDILFAMREALDNMPVFVSNYAKPDFDFYKVRNQLGIRLLEGSRNREYLKDKPYKDMQAGLVAVGAISVTDDYEIVITNDVLKELCVDEETMFDAAFKAAAYTDEPTLMDLERLALNLPTVNMLTYFGVLDRPSSPMVLSTKSGHYGASALMYPGIMAQIGNILEDDFYILPSSLHELMVIPSGITSSSSVPEMLFTVKEANRQVVAPEDILSEHVYFYSRTEGLEISA